jgi:hypothetical protein
MQTLTFNTTTKQVQLFDGPRGSSTIEESFDNVSTVKGNSGYYEVMQKVDEVSGSAIPDESPNIKYEYDYNNCEDFFLFQIISLSLSYE